MRKHCRTKGVELRVCFTGESRGANMNINKYLRILGVGLAVSAALIIYPVSSFADDGKAGNENGPERSISMSAEYPGVDVASGEDVTMNLDFHNRGKEDESLDVRLVNVPKGWEAHIKTFKYEVTGISIPAGEDKSLTFEAKPKTVFPLALLGAPAAAAELADRCALYHFPCRDHCDLFCHFLPRIHAAGNQIGLAFHFNFAGRIGKPRRLYLGAPTVSRPWKRCRIDGSREMGDRSRRSIGGDSRFGV
jgi:hypothetical protein